MRVWDLQRVWLGLRQLPNMQRVTHFWARFTEEAYQLIIYSCHSELERCAKA